jgi:hypothetical protein
MDQATDQANDADATSRPAGDGAADAARIDELEATVEQLRKDLWTARDAAIGAEAEAGALKVRNRELEVLVAQLRDALAAQTRWARLVGKLTGNRYVSTLIARAKDVLRPLLRP